jgi:hypothetical protein
MPKLFKILALLLLSFSLTSCVELVEEIKINEDLSGEYRLYLKHNGLDLLFNSLAKNIDTKGLDDGLENLKQQEGISKLRTDINPKKGRFFIQFHFSDSKSLSHAFYGALGVKKQFYHKNFLKINPSKIRRPNLTPYLVKYAESQGLLDELPSENILDYLSYRYRIISPKKIKSATPANTSFGAYEYTQLYSLKTLLLDKRSTKSIIKTNK